jgi:hypothetical protein
MVINHLEKLFVTKDASTIMTELEVQHPAAKMLVLAAMAQEKEIGDGTNFVSSWERHAGPVEDAHCPCAPCHAARPRSHACTCRMA